MYYNTSFKKVINTSGSAPQTITKEEALFDLDYYMYLLTTSCASFNLFYYKNSVNQRIIDENYKISKKRIASLDEPLLTLTFLDILKQITCKIKDLHSFLVYRGFDKEKWGMFTSPLIPFYSKDYCTDKLLNELNVKEINNNLVLEPDVFYKVPVKLSMGIKYRLAKLMEVENNVQIYFDKKIQQTLIRADYNGKTLNEIENIFDTPESDYWFLPDCRDTEGDFNRIMDSLCEKAKRARNKKVIFIDSRFNYGGSPYRYIELLFNLFGLDFSMVEREVQYRVDNMEVEGRVLVSKPIIQEKIKNISDKESSEYIFWKRLENKIDADEFKWISEPSRKLEWEYNPKLLKNIEFNGLIVLTISNESMSFGELIFDYIKDVLGYKNIILVGEKSKGAVCFGNINTFYLPNSKIRLCLSSSADYDKYKKEFYESYVECRGFIPTYWATNSNEYEETLKMFLNENLIKCTNIQN